MTTFLVDSFLQYLRGRGVPGNRLGTLRIVMRAGRGKSRLIGLGSRRTGRAGASCCGAGESGCVSICDSICCRCLSLAAISVTCNDRASRTRGCRTSAVGFLPSHRSYL